MNNRALLLASLHPLVFHLGPQERPLVLSPQPLERLVQIHLVLPRNEKGQYERASHLVSQGSDLRAVRRLACGAAHRITLELAERHVILIPHELLEHSPQGHLALLLLVLCLLSETFQSIEDLPLYAGFLLQ